MDIYTKEIPLYKNVFCGDVDRELEKEMSLPDYSPDITRLVKLDATPYIESAVLNGDKCLVSGIYIFSMLYESDESNSLSYTTFNIPFNEKIDIKNTAKDGTVNAKATVKRIGCKIINPRKFAVRVKSVLNISAQGTDKVKICDTSLFPQNIHSKKDSFVYPEKVDERTNEFTFEESYNLSEKDIPADDILMNCMSIEEPESYVSDGKVQLKTNATSKLIYTGEGGNGKYIMSKKTFPANMIFDDITVSDNSLVCASASVISSETDVDVDSYGENRVIRLKFTVKAKVNVFEKINCEFATDAFACGKKNHPVLQKFTTLTDDDAISRVFPIDFRFAPEKELTEITDYNAKINDCKIKNDDMGAKLCGTYTLSVFGKTEDRYENIDFSDNFEERLTDTALSFETCDTECIAFEANVILTSDGELNGKMLCRTRTVPKSYKTFSAVTELITDEESDLESCNLICCYPTSKDSLWSIAKKYFVDPNVLYADNTEVFSAAGELIKPSPVIIKK